MLFFPLMQTTVPPKSPKKSTPKSPPKSPSCWNCCHEPDRLNVLTHHSGYFNPTYLKKNPNFPNTCSGKDCGKKFVVKPKAAVTAGKYKVSTKSPVHVCCNASNSRRAFCVFAHCDDYHKKELEKLTSWSCIIKARKGAKKLWTTMLVEN